MHVLEVDVVHELFVEHVLLVFLLLGSKVLVVEQVVPGHPIVGFYRQQLVQQNACLRSYHPSVEVVELPRADLLEKV